MERIRIQLVFCFILVLSSCDYMVENNGGIIQTNSWSSNSLGMKTSSPDQSNPIDPTLDWINQEIEYGKEGVFEIVDALEEYYQNQSVYPETLDSLVPEYIVKLPLTISGEPFDYRQNSSEIYFVSFSLTRKGGENNLFICGYLRSHEIWECSVGPPL